MKPLLSAFFLAFISSHAAAHSPTGGVPRFDVGPSCREAAAGSPGLVQNADSCRKSEDAARQSLVQQWSQFPTGDRASCVTLTTTGTRGTYTELLTCLEMKRDARRLPDHGGTVGLGGMPRRR